MAQPLRSGDSDDGPQFADVRADAQKLLTAGPARDTEVDAVVDDEATELDEDADEEDDEDDDEDDDEEDETEDDDEDVDDADENEPVADDEPPAR